MVNENVLALTPNVFDIARIERLLASINAKLGSMESIMMENDEEMRADRNWEEDEDDE